LRSGQQGNRATGQQGNRAKDHFVLIFIRIQTNAKEEWKLSGEIKSLLFSIFAAIS